MTRREFLKRSGTVAAGVGVSLLSGSQKSEAAGPYPTSYSTKLPQVVLGKTGVSVSRLGLGGAIWIKDGPEADVPYIVNAIKYGIDNGISYIDTAHNYLGTGCTTSSEQRIGMAIAGRRSEVFISTKFEATSFSPGSARTYDKIMPEVEQSLTRLGTDFIDLLQVHMVYDTDDVTAFGQTNGAYWTLCRLRDQGVIRFIGMSGHSECSKVKTALTMYDWDCFTGFANGLNSSLPYWNDQVPVCRSKNMGVIGMKPLGGGTPAASVGFGMGMASYQELIRYALSTPRGQTVDVIIPGIGNYVQLMGLINVVKSFVPMTEYECGQMERRLNQTYMWITDAKRRPDNVGVAINDIDSKGVIVTSVFSDGFYVESEDRTGGIKVTNVTSTVGKRVKIGGMMKTDANGERYVYVNTAGGGYVTQISTGASVMPLALANSALGGSGWAPGPANNQGQLGVTNGKGMNNIGLLVRTTGRVVERGTGYFIIDDGCGVPSGGTVNGVRVDCGTYTAPDLGKFVGVTGISTLYKVDPDYFRCIRIRSLDDIQTFN